MVIDSRRNIQDILLEKLKSWVIKICKVKTFFIITGVLILLTIFINIGIILSAKKYIYTDISEIPPRTVVLVLGARVHGTRLSPVLEDRVKNGIILMENQKGKKIQIW